MKLEFIKSFFFGILVFALLVSSIPPQVLAVEEGMFTPDQIATLPLKKKGLKIKPSELYDPGLPSISDAIVRVNIPAGGFGTGEFISRDGLILTNHHVVFDALVAESDKQEDLATDGFAAKSRTQELPATGYTAIITKRIENVTGRIREGIADAHSLSGQEQISERMETLEREEQAKAPGSLVRVQELNDGLFYYLYETVTLKDLRIVYAPPKNIGFFGGDPDNFEWTRHTGDFAFLRAYVGPEGSFDEYSPDNIPFSPRKHLAISLDGIKEGDLAMVMGYPGGTTRYRESQSIEYSQEVSFPFIEDYVREWSGALSAISESEPEKAIHLQAQIFSLNNTIKVYEGNIAAMKRAGIVGKRRETEARLAKWIDSDESRQMRFGDLLRGLDRISQKYYRNSRRDRVLSIFPSSSTTQAFYVVYEAINAVNKGQGLGESEDDRKKRTAQIKEVFSGYEPKLEIEMIRFFLRKIDELSDDQKFDTAEDIFAGLETDDRRNAEAELAKEIASKFDTAEKVLAIYESDIDTLKKQYRRIVTLALGLGQFKSKMAEAANEFNSAISSPRLKYQKALAEMQKKPLYPDANATLRFTYGNVAGYRPREAVIYKPFTTLDGVIEKDTGKEPFDVPKKLKELHRAGEFGRFGESGTLFVNFLTSTDIIGGNSGSPVLNARGEQVGIVFDSNYEGLGNNIFYSEERGRTISVDIRYVLFLTEKFGDCGWILNELDLRQKRSMKARAR